MDEQKQKKFTVKDKRFLDESGQIRSDEQENAGVNTHAPSAADDQGPSTKTTADETRSEDFFTEVNFYNFVLSLSTTALYHFGDFPDPATNSKDKNLAAAKHTIDILNMLKEKTKGNLEEYERNLLDGILYELRLRYVREKA